MHRIACFLNFLREPDAVFFGGSPESSNHHVPAWVSRPAGFGVKLSCVIRKFYLSWYADRFFWGVMRAKAKQYSLREKAKILKFVDRYNEQYGRGGQMAAAAKYEVSRMSLFNWQNEGLADVKSSGSGSKVDGRERAQLLASLRKMDRKLAKTLALLASVQAELSALIDSH